MDRSTSGQDHQTRQLRRADRAPDDPKGSPQEQTAERLRAAAGGLNQPKPADPDRVPRQPIAAVAPALPTVTFAAPLRESTATSIAQDYGTTENVVTRPSAPDDAERTAHLARARQRRQPEFDDRPAASDPDLCDDIAQQLFAVGLAMYGTQRRCADQPELATRIADHINELRSIILHLRDAAPTPGRLPMPLDDTNHHQAPDVTGPTVALPTPRRTHPQNHPDRQQCQPVH